MKIRTYKDIRWNIIKSLCPICGHKRAIIRYNNGAYHCSKCKHKFEVK